MASKEELTDFGVLTEKQKQFLDSLSSESYFCQHYYFTGGTPLSAFYLQHRFSEDIDLFSEEEEVHVQSVRAFLKKIEGSLGITKIDYRQFHSLHSFQLFFSATDTLKIDFNYYPFPRIEKGPTYKNIPVDSILDIAVNKVQTIATNPRARDFIDVYLIVKEKGYAFRELLNNARNKFDWHTDPLQLATRFFLAESVKDFPRMIKQIDHQEWREFFVNEATKLKSEIME